MSNPFALIPQPKMENTQDPTAVYKWLYQVWLKLKGTETDLPTVDGVATDGKARAINAQVRVGVLESQHLNTRLQAIENGSQWPVGCYHFNNGTDPATSLGFGTWSKVSEGQFIAGYKAGDPDFGTMGGTGGAKTHKHTVDVGNTTSTVPSATVNAVTVAGTTAVGDGTHTHDVDPASVDSSTESNLPPYFVLSVWQRTA